ncbi:GFA family protein [Sabulicella glaciei]|uniref:GFA family protein n=1 Tax=Sabulicella glaciei TaxID=2984948 RepID=A0ABT3NPI3_9PROT|nr:GFA family protein [Roseococcus sp. MDT2-1-1]MCW8084072.1 GFA family protein [Roseococcus sp. MDT2-1-1]
MSREGGCCCGQLRFRTEGEPLRSGLCHCLDCRKLHAAPFMAFVVFPEEKVTITGEARSFESQPGYERSFCPQCGAHVFGRLAKSEAGEVELHHGSFDETSLWPPEYELWTVRRDEWLGPIPSVMDHHARNRE